MKLRRYFGKLKRLRSPLLLRQIVGRSMQPSFTEGGILVGFGWFKGVMPNDVVIIHHNGREKVKRVHQVRKGELYVLGDNSELSTDSRDFGWLPLEAVTAKVVWPRTEAV